MWTWGRAQLVAAGACSGVCVLSASGAGMAAEAAVRSDLTAQYYDVLSPYGDPVVQRRRYTHTLDLDVSDLDGDTSYHAPELAFHTRLRLDADFGQFGTERDPEALGRYAPGLEQAPFDLMVAYLEGRHYLGGALGFRVGRQYQMDSLGWWSFDGALVRADVPGAFGLEAYGGFEQRDTLSMLGTSRYEADGVFRGSRDDLEQNEWPSYLEETRLAPAYGGSVQTLGLGFLQARLSYRKVLNRDDVLVSLFPEPDEAVRTVGESRTSTERAGFALSLRQERLGSLDGEAVYDVFVRRLSELQASLDWYASDATTLGVRYDYWFPVFDGDSIFNWFGHAPSQTGEISAYTELSPRADIALRAGVRVYGLALTPGESLGEDERWVDELAGLNARYHWGQGTLRLDADSQWGDTGHRVGGNVSATRRFLEGYYDALVVLSLYDFEDELRPERGTTSAGYVVGAGLSPEIESVLLSRLGLEWEHWFNRLDAHQFRVLLTLAITEFP
ncbi:MAG TPA: hypothetical protein VFU02_09675 [Polyangiaceae bacterium]|nr:hypothetical protein [Polyangiaceae bacterium]